nr:Ig-like domain repeat protein [Chloroflexaceae bacterium]
MHLTLRRTLLVLCFSAALFALFAVAALQTAQPTPANQLAAARDRAQVAESYRISAEIDQRLTPRPLPGMIGERDSRVRMQLDGTVEGAGESRYTLRGDGPGLETSIMLVQQEGRWLLERDGKRQPVEAPPGAATPALNPLDYLAAASNVRQLESRVERDQQFTRYAFQLDGANLARHMQAQAPAGTRVVVPPALAQLSGTGELWVDGFGLPARQTLTLAMPGISPQYDGQVMLTIHFSEMVAPAVGWRPLVSLRPALAWLDLPTLVALSGLLAVCGLLCYAMVRWFAMARRLLALGFSSLLFLFPLLIVPPAAAAPATPIVPAPAAPAPALAPAAPPASPPLAAMAPMPATIVCGSGTPGVDTDNDGLSDQQEFCLGTDAYAADSDNDLLPDGLEVRGVTTLGRQWTSNPLSPDSNGDGRFDNEEWPIANPTLEDGWDTSGTAPGWDLDGDMQPNLWDEDDDGDQVPDRLDISASARSVLRPNFTLGINGNYDGYHYIDVQVRPQDAQRLRYTLTSLDWPNDNAGQMQDLDNSRDDLRLIPLLEIRTSTPPQAELAQRYGVSTFSRDGQTYIYAPLSPIEEGGQIFAFGTRVAYAPNQRPSWDARMVWMVQGQVDQRVGLMGVNTSVLPIQTYAEEQFSITGLNVITSQEFESALFALPDETSDQQLFNTIFALNGSFMRAQRLEGQAAGRSTLEEAVVRLDGENTPETQRWGINATIAADYQRAAHLDAGLAGLTGQRINAMLDANFATSAQPALILATQQETGVFNANAGGLAMAGGFSINLGSLDQTVTRGLRLGLYRHNGTWQALTNAEMQAVAQLRGGDLAADLAALQADNPHLTLAALQAINLTIYSTWTTGRMALIASNGVPFAPAVEPDSRLAGLLNLNNLSSTRYVYQVGALATLANRPDGAFAGFAEQEYARAHNFNVEILGAQEKLFGIAHNSITAFGLTYNNAFKPGIVGVLLKAKSAYSALDWMKTTNAAVNAGNTAAKKVGYFSKMSLATKKFGIAMAVVQIGLIWTQFGLFTDFSDPLSRGPAIAYAIVATVVTLITFAIGLNPAGAILMLVLALVDLILYLAGANFQIMATIVNGLTKFFFDVNELTKLEKVDFTNFRTRLRDANAGMTVGNRVALLDTFEATIVRTSDGSRGDLNRSFASAVLKHAGSSLPVASANLATARNCQILDNYTRIRCSNEVGVEYLFDIPQINAQVAVTPEISVRTRYEECGLAGSICEDYSRNVTLPEEQIEPIRVSFDVLPNTVDGLVNWNLLTNRDHDHDGIDNSAEASLGLNPDAWDSDGDGLSDGFERNIGTSASQADSDNDGLSDAHERRLGTDAMRADSDSDGLNDGAEAFHRTAGGSWAGGWQVNLPGNLQVQVYPNPSRSDEDADGLSDAAERQSSLSPFAANTAPRLDMRLIPLASDGRGRAGVYAAPGQAVRVDLSLLNSGSQAITTTLELCLPAMLTDLSGGTLFGARRPATQTGACTDGTRYSWDFAANPLLVSEAVTTTLNARINPGLATPTSASISASLPYTGADRNGQPENRTASQSFALSADLDDPTITLAGVDEGAFLRGSSLVLGGSASDATSWVTAVELSANGGGSYQPASLSSGTNEWAFTWSLPNDGSYRLQARATDYLGRRATSNQLNVTVDNTVPTVQFSLAAGAFVRPGAGGNSVRLQGTAGDNLAGLAEVQISINGQPWRSTTLAAPNSSSSAWSYDWPLANGSEAQGRHSISLRAVDRAGNQSAILATPIVVDMLPPTDALLSTQFDARELPQLPVGQAVPLAGQANDAGNAPLPARPQPLNGELDALNSATVWLMPDAAAETSGATQLAWLGDTDGDGRGDLAIGLPSGAGDAGRVLVVRGRGGDWPATPDVEALAESASSFIGRDGAGLGAQLAAAGDANADGLFDLLIGDQANGVAFLLLGRSGGMGREVRLDGPESGRVALLAPGLRMVAAAGDVNRDNADDLLLGTDDTLYLVLGRIGAWPSQVDVNREAAARFSLPAGASASGVGDLNGDGFDDLALGNPANGNLALYWGDAGLTPGANRSLAPFATLGGFGGVGQLAALGDVNGDQLSDMLYTTASAPRLVLGRSSGTWAHNVEFNAYTPSPDGFVAAVGDVNADGLNDFLLGAAADSSAYLIHGAATLVANSNPAARLTGVLAAASAPYATGADLNCDASSDLLLLPQATPPAAPPRAARTSDADNFIPPGRLPGASITSGPPAAPAPANPRYVDDDYCATCRNDGLIWNSTAFNSIQSALDTAGSVGTVVVRPGVYAPFTVGSSHSVVTISGVNPDAVFVDGNSGPFAARISGATGVRLTNLTMRNATVGVDLVNAGVGGYSNAALRTRLDRLVIHNVTNAVAMNRVSTLDLTRSTLAGQNSSGPYIAVGSTPDSSVIANWEAPSAGGTIPDLPTWSIGAGGRLLAEDGRIYAVGGNNTSQFASVAPGGSWVNHAAVPVNVTANSLVAAGDGRVFALPPATFDPTPGQVQALAVDGDYVYVGGDFATVDNSGQALSANRIARWNRVTGMWEALGAGLSGINRIVSIAASGPNNVFVAMENSRFSEVHRWNGSSWTRIIREVRWTGGSSCSEEITSLVIQGGFLYVGGCFTEHTADGTNWVDNLGGLSHYSLSTFTWSAPPGVSPGTFGQTAMAMVADASSIYVATEDGRIVQYRPALSDVRTLLEVLWNGSSSEVSAVALDGTTLYVGGYFNQVQQEMGNTNAIPASNIAQINLANLGQSNYASAVGSGVNSNVWALAAGGGSLVAMGSFNQAGGVAVPGLARYQSNTWSRIGGAASSNNHRAVAVDSSGQSYLGGSFSSLTNPDNSSFAAHDIARFSGSTWQSLGSGNQGLSSNLPAAMQVYSISGNSWAAGGRLWAGLGAGATMVGDDNGSLYAVTSGTNFFRYNTATNTWQRRAAFPVTTAAGTTLAVASGQIYGLVGGTQRLVRYDPAGNSWTEPASVPGSFSGFGNIGAGVGLEWDGGDFLYATNGNNGNRFARYSLSGNAWEDRGTMPFSIHSGGSLVRLGDSIYAARGSAVNSTGREIERLGPLNIPVNKLTVTNVAFVAPASAASPDWINVDANTEDFAYTFTMNQWTGGGTWQTPTPPGGALLPLASARLLDQSNNVYRTAIGTALTAGYFTPRPDARVSPLYCATCANDGFVWGESAFNSVQAAIDSGAQRVLLAPGVYRESVYMVSGVQLIGAGADLSVIEPPASSTARAIVSAEGVRGVTLARVSLAGSGTAANRPAGAIIEQGAVQVQFARSIVRNSSIALQINGDSTRAEILNNSFVGNGAGLNVSGAGSAGRIDLRNNAFADHSGTALSFSGGTVLHRYNAYWQNTTSISDGTANPQPGLGDVARDPMFINPANGDYRPQDGSPLLGAGNPNDPTPPGVGGRIDIGYLQRGQAAFYADDDYGSNSFNDGLDWQVDAFASVQDALDAAARTLATVGCGQTANGTCAYQITVGVGPGSYTEQLRVPSQVQLIGSGAERTTLNGGGGSPITLDGVVHVSISGFTLTGASGTAAGLRATNAANQIDVNRTIMRGNSSAVRFENGASGKVAFNTIVNNTTNGVLADGAGSWARVENNIFSTNGTALRQQNEAQLLSDFNLLHASTTVNYNGVAAGAGDQIADPRFANAAANNFRLQPTSPAVDAAAAWSTPPAGGGSRADLGYAEVLARPLTLLFGKEGISCSIGNSGVAQVELGLLPVADATRPITDTTGITWSPVTLTGAAGTTVRGWTASVTPQVAGLHRIYTRASDAAGNRENDGLVQFSGAFVADGTTPTVSWVTSGPFSSSAAAVEVLAQSDDGSTPTLLIEVNNSQLMVPAGWVAAPWSGSGPRQFRAVLALPAGNHSLVALARDAAGNSGRSPALSLTVTNPAQHQVTFASPANNSFTNRGSLTLAGHVRFASSNGSGRVQLRVNGGAPVEASLASPNASSSSWIATVNLGAPGVHTITATPINDGGTGSVATLNLTLDQTAPTLTVPNTTPIVTRSVSLSGSVSDAASGVRAVAVSFDGGFVWVPASVSGSTWSLNWTAPNSPLNVRYPVRVRATDNAGNETSSALAVIVDTNAPVLGAINFNHAPESRLDGSSGNPPFPTLNASWLAPTDDGGSVTLYAEINQLASSRPTTPAGGSLSQQLNGGGAWYLHMRAVDAAGNETSQRFGPWLVRDVGTCAVLPLELDGLLDLERGEWRGDRHMVDDDERPANQQAFYAALDVDNLYLGWRGARWTVDGTLTVYFDSGAGGSTRPAQPLDGVAALPFEADLALAITSPTEASLWRFNGTWQPISLPADRFAFSQGGAGDTEIRLSRSE